MGAGIHINEPTPSKKMKKDNMCIDGYWPRDGYSSDNKGKGIIVNQNPMTELIVGIKCACEIDRETMDPWDEGRIYRVCGWVVDGEDFWTESSGTLPNPEWYRRYAIYSGTLNSNLVLNLEVFRRYSQLGMETSDGHASVGRCQVRLPKVFRDRENRRCGLVTAEGSAAGFIFIDLELRKLKLRKLY